VRACLRASVRAKEGESLLGKQAGEDLKFSGSDPVRAAADPGLHRADAAPQKWQRSTETALSLLHGGLGWWGDGNAGKSSRKVSRGQLAFLMDRDNLFDKLRAILAHERWWGDCCDLRNAKRKE
jgi:hypothetical protein